MKIPTLVVTLLAALPLAAFAIETVTVDSSITAISLFQDSARVTRTVQIDAPAGKSIIRFERLPTNVDASALQADLADALGVIRNAKIFIPEDAGIDPALEKAQQALNEHLRSMEAVRQKKQLALERSSFAQKMADSFANRYGELSEGGVSLSVEQGMKTWELVDQTRIEAQAISDEAERELESLRQTERELRQTLREAAQQAQLSRNVAEVEIDLDSAQAIQLSIHYQALAARWSPQYELRADPESGNLGFVYLASIQQQTGEDWSDVSLSLHTNQANRQGNVPVLNPFHLYQAPAYYGNAEDVFELNAFSVESEVRNRSREKVGLAQAAAADAAPPPPSQQVATIDASSVSFQIALPSRITARSDREPTLVPIVETEFQADFWSETVPKVQLDAYLRARAKNQLELPILAGPALAFVDGKLSSKVFLEKTLPSEEIELSLGIDSRITVKRIEGAQENKNTGLIGKTVTVSRSFTNQITSFHKEPHKIVVVDQFPIATDAKIEITPLAPKTAEVTIKPEQADSGIFQWEAVLQPEQSQDFLTRYQVVHPRDWSIAPPL